jgi:Pvc16 N-terminal domain
MSAEAIYNVTIALQKRLQDALVAAGYPANSVFVGPLDDTDAQGAKLILFLYRVMPNASLRNREHRVPSDNPPPPVLIFNNSLPLDLYYLVAVGTLAGSSVEPLLALGVAMRDLSLSPDLVGAGVGHEAVHVSLEPLATEEISRIWALFPTLNYRTSVAYLATPVWIDPPQPQPQARRVMEDTLLAGQRAREDGQYV